MNDRHTWAQSPYIVILYYRGYSCGKFVSNVLSFNENFVPQMALTPSIKRYNSKIEQLVQQFDKELLKDYKIQQIFLTIPPSKSECKQWEKYELGCSMFWGFWAGDLNFNKLHPVVPELLTHKKYCFIVAHSYSVHQMLASKFPNATTIELVNDTEVRQLSINLKSTINYLPAPLTKPIDNSIKFDIGSLFNKQQFFDNIYELLSKFDIPQRELDSRVYKYYQQYVNLYQ